MDIQNLEVSHEISTVYQVGGAPYHSHKSWRLSPDKVSFSFLNGKLNRVSVAGLLVLKDGTLGDRAITIPNLYYWNITDWPNWLTRVYLVALDDLGLKDARVS